MDQFNLKSRFNLNQFSLYSDEFIIVSLSPTAPVKQEINSLLQQELQQEITISCVCAGLWTNPTCPTAGNLSQLPNQVIETQ